MTDEAAPLQAAVADQPLEQAVGTVLAAFDVRSAEVHDAEVHDTVVAQAGELLDGV